MQTRDYQFTPKGLSGFIVRERDGFWYVIREADGFALERRSTCKGAVAAAHAYAKFQADLAAGIKPAWMIRAEEIAEGKAS